MSMRQYLDDMKARSGLVPVSRGIGNECAKGKRILAHNNIASQVASYKIEGEPGQKCVLYVKEAEAPMARLLMLGSKYEALG